MATKALIRSFGSSSKVAGSRLEPAVTKVSVKLPSRSYTVVAKPCGTMLSMLISGELSMMPLYMPTPTLTPTTASTKKIRSSVLVKPRKKRLAILRFLEEASFNFFSVASFP